MQQTLMDTSLKTRYQMSEVNGAVGSHYISSYKMSFPNHSKSLTGIGWKDLFLSLSQESYFKSPQGKEDKTNNNKKYKVKSK